MHITREQKEAANQTDLVDYLSKKGYELKKMGTCYKIKIRRKFPGDMSSLSIFENRRGWKRWSTGEHGGDAISFLEKNMGMSFQEAVIELIGGQTFSNTTPKPSPISNKTNNSKKTLELPQKCDGKFSRLFAYLNKTRMIDANIISKMISDKMIYQDIHNNVVFVGYNEQNKAAFACVRGTNTSKPFKGDCDGSDKKYAFSIEGTNKSKLYIFEAPIDLLSHATLTNKFIKNEKAWTVHSRLCLAGTSDVALKQYLKTHPDIKELHFFLDNDAAGRSAAEKHCKKYSEKGFVTFNHCPKYNDVNEELVAFITHKPPPNTVPKHKGMKI